ncbi:hypothetical protein COV18_04945 [Candidatus Woesearchaeota archaeon CG10_big_fil_rev_8_21_14_0_10_37_12]|nr:MAG: hypothetical protein COV18_04945 [Candidatus Woesearchaeota archaeon CG10_big_fil_rev_8_21_14_0_10_37_12]
MIKQCRLVEPIHCKLGQTAQDAAKTIKESGLRQIYVVDETMKPVGIISISDINGRLVAEGKGPETKVEEIMTKDILVFDDGGSVLKAYNEMKKLNIGNCPVTEHGKFIGILTINEALDVITNPTIELN